MSVVIVVLSILAHGAPCWRIQVSEAGATKFDSIDQRMLVVTNQSSDEKKRIKIGANTLTTTLMDYEVMQMQPGRFPVAIEAEVLMSQNGSRPDLGRNMFTQLKVTAEIPAPTQRDAENLAKGTFNRVKDAATKGGVVALTNFLTAMVGISGPGGGMIVNAINLYHGKLGSPKDDCLFELKRREKEDGSKVDWIMCGIQAAAWLYPYSVGTVQLVFTATAKTVLLGGLGLLSQYTWWSGLQWLWNSFLPGPSPNVSAFLPPDAAGSIVALGGKLLAYAVCGR